MQALLLPLAGDWYALELATVREVVPSPVLRHLPRAPAAVLGVLNLRGDVVPVLDTARLLGQGSSTRVEHVVVVDSELGAAGLAVDALPRRASMGAPAGPTDLAAGRGKFAVDGGEVATLLDIGLVLAALQGAA
jgi:purine-binding chemotaxis protein CheW